MEKKKEEILAEGREMLEHQPDISLGITLDALPTEEHDGVFLFETDRDEYLKKTGSGR
ncbi:hypothetical protein D3C76_1350010 [compost metagenome]